MQQLEAFDSMQMVKRQQDNRRLTRDLQECRTGHQHMVQPTRRPAGTPQRESDLIPGLHSATHHRAVMSCPPHHLQGSCPHGKFDNVTAPRVQTAGEYPGSHKYGAWGRDPKPMAGQESWYWMVMLTSSNKYGHYVRMYTSLSSLIVGVSTPGKQLLTWCMLVAPQDIYVQLCSCTIYIYLNFFGGGVLSR